MKKTTVVPKKKRGPPATGKGTQIQVRLQPDHLAGLDNWIAKNEPGMSRADAIRQMALTMLGLIQKKTDRRYEPAVQIFLKQIADRNVQKVRAKELAGGAIDKLTDAEAAPDDQASRKQRLLKGPEEFREARVDRKSKK